MLESIMIIPFQVIKQVKGPLGRPFSGASATSDVSPDTVQSFDQFQPQDGWTVVHETDDPVKAVLAARATAYGGFDTRIVKEGRTVWSVFVDACKTGLIDAPAWIDGKFPEWLVLVHDYDLPANEALVMRMPTEPQMMATMTAFSPFILTMRILVARSLTICGAR